MHASRIQHALGLRLGQSERTPFELSDFKAPRLHVERGAIVLQGASHIGKTHFALAHFEYPLLVSELDDLKDISLRTDGIVFDQMCFTHPWDRKELNLTADKMIRLLDMEVSRAIGARYQNVRIPKGMPRIFTTNKRLDRGEAIFPRGVNAAEQEGIDSRVTIMPWMSDDLRVNPGPDARGM